MGFDVRPLIVGAALVACGFVVGAAWRYGLWGLLTAALLIAVWVGVGTWWSTVWATPQPAPVAAPVAGHDPDAHRLLLDAAPTPMLEVVGGTVRALNRAARRLCATDDRVLPVPPGLADREVSHLRYLGRGWRADRVVLGDARMVVALIDIEQEERAAEARATAEVIHVLGHELLNGLAPIASLAESGLAAVDARPDDPALLREILATLARRAEGLQRFTEAYRTLARLPGPSLRSVTIATMVDDLGRLFAGRWPGIALHLDVRAGAWRFDRDQISQALWALLQNAAEAPATGVTLTAEVADDALLLTVADDGPGVPADVAAQIFRPFHTTKPDGTGIGLSLARQIALAHGGTLALNRGAGATFRLTLPA